MVGIFLLLTFIYPGFDCGSDEVVVATTSRVSNRPQHAPPNAFLQPAHLEVSQHT